jgi:hypothetical protein
MGLRSARKERRSRLVRMRLAMPNRGNDSTSGAAEVGKCDAGRARRLHAYGARTAGGDQEEGPDRPAQQAKGDKHCLSHAVMERRHLYLRFPAGCYEWIGLGTFATVFLKTCLQPIERHRAPIQWYL